MWFKMLDLQLLNLLAVLLFAVTMSCFARDPFDGYHYLPPKQHLAPIFTQQVYNKRNGFEFKLSLPMVNYYNPNIMESIVSMTSEYQPIPMILTKQYTNGNHIDKQKNLEQQNKEISTKTTEKYKELNTKSTERDFNQSKGNDNKYDSNEVEDVNIESTTENTEGTTEYDELQSTTEDYNLLNRIAPEVVASLLG